MSKPDANTVSLSHYTEALESLKAQQKLRQCRALSRDALTHFCSNDYLGLSQDPRLIQAAQQALADFGAGTGSARLVGGTLPLTQALEAALAEFKQAESALVFNSGYQANVGILQGLVGPGDWVVADKLNHASLVDGCLLSGAHWTRYRHLDMNHLETRLKAAHAKRQPGRVLWIVTDSLFSMDGDFPALPELVRLAKQYEAYILLDEAHATGIFGDTRSSGLAEAMGVCQDITLQMGTLSKALGCFGAYVAGPQVLIETLVNRARSFIYSTALPPSVQASAMAALEIVQHDPSPKQRLWENVALFRQGLQEAGLPFDSETPIFSWILGAEATTMVLSQQLQEAGFFIQGIRPPTVPEGTARLRITLSAAHTPLQIENLINTLQRFIGQAQA